MFDGVYLTKQEAAEYLRISKSNLESYMREIPHFRIGRKGRGKILIRRSDLDHWIEHYRIDGQITKTEIEQILDEIQRKA